MKKHFYYHGILGENNPLLHYPELFEATLTEFAQRNFEDASLNDILKKANMSKGSLYHHFGDKFGLYLSMMDLIVKKKTAFFADMLRQRQDDFDFFHTVKQLVKATMEFMQAEARFYQVLHHNLEASAALKNQLIEFFPHDPNSGFDALVRAAIKAGQIDRRYAPQFIAGVFEILFEHVHRLLPPNNPAEEIAGVVGQLIDLVQYGISAQGKKEER